MKIDAWVGVEEVEEEGGASMGCGLTCDGRPRPTCMINSVRRRTLDETDVLPMHAYKYDMVYVCDNIFLCEKHHIIFILIIKNIK